VAPGGLQLAAPTVYAMPMARPHRKVVMAVLEVARDRGIGRRLYRRAGAGGDQTVCFSTGVNVDLGNPAARPPLHATGSGLPAAGRGGSAGDGPGTRRPRLGKPAEIERGPASTRLTPRRSSVDVKAQVESGGRVRCRRRVQADRPAEIRLGNSLAWCRPPASRRLFPAFLYVYVRRRCYVRRHWQPARLALKRPRTLRMG